jgi:hypothetical protein
MARLIDRTDWRTTWEYDLVMSPTPDGYEIEKTDRHSAETLMQVTANGFKTISGEFNLTSFGFSPWRFVGGHMSPTLIRSIEEFVLVNMQRSGITDDGLLISVKAAPVSKAELAVRIEYRMSNDPSTVIGKMDALVSTQDNKIRPLLM